MANEFGKYVFYKDITPAFLDSDRSGGNGFTDTSRLETLLKDWGFSDVDVKEVTMWKISSKNQYVEDGPRLEWKGKLYVRDTDQLQVIKWKNKNKTKYNKSVKNSEGRFCLNDGATQYSGSEYVYIHITEIGFGMKIEECYKWASPLYDKGADWSWNLDDSSFDVEAVAWDSDSDSKNLGKVLSMEDVNYDKEGNKINPNILSRIATKIKISDKFRIGENKTYELISFDDGVNNINPNGSSYKGIQIYKDGIKKDNVPFWGASPSAYPIVLYSNFNQISPEEYIKSIVVEKSNIKISIQKGEEVLPEEKYSFDRDKDLICLYRRYPSKTTTSVSKNFNNTIITEDDWGSGSDDNVYFKVKELPTLNLNSTSNFFINILAKNNSEQETTYQITTDDIYKNPEFSTFSNTDLPFWQVLEEYVQTWEIKTPAAFYDWNNSENIFYHFNSGIMFGDIYPYNDSGEDPDVKFDNYLNWTIINKVRYMDFKKESEIIKNTGFDRESPGKGIIASKYFSNSDLYKNISGECFCEGSVGPYHGYFQLHVGIDFFLGTGFTHYFPKLLTNEKSSYEITKDDVVDFFDTLQKIDRSELKNFHGKDYNYVYNSEKNSAGNWTRSIWGLFDLYNTNRNNNVGLAIVLWKNGAEVLENRIIFTKYIESNNKTYIKVTNNSDQEVILNSTGTEESGGDNHLQPGETATYTVRENEKPNTVTISYLNPLIKAQGGYRYIIARLDRIPFETQ